MKRPIPQRVWGVLVAVTAAIVLAGALIFAAPGKDPDLRQISSHRIADAKAGFTEVSGLANAANGGFWSVSDDTAKLFRLDDTGKIQPDLSLPAERGLEGVAVDTQRQRLLSVNEDETTILVHGPDGSIRRVRMLDLPGGQELAQYFPHKGNNGLEAIEVEPDTGTIFLLKERRPRLLIEIDPDLTRIRKALVLSEAIGFHSRYAKDADLDVTGLAFDGARHGLWMTSDTGKAVFLFDLRTAEARGWELIHTVKGKHETVTNAEGIALSPDGARLFVVTDNGKNSRLISYGVE